MLSSFRDSEPDGRFSRQEPLQGWDQTKLLQSRCLVIGAGSLGNELLKNLALVGVGALGIVDFDLVEPSNLPRCVLFRLGDVGRPKAEVARERLGELAPELQCEAFCADVLTEIGAGLFEEYDLVLGAVDSVAARWQVNRLARRAGVPWIDAGVDRFCGQVTRFDPADGACYECGITGPMWQRIFERHSCGRWGGVAEARPVVALALPVVSLTAAIQAQAAVSLLMGTEMACAGPLQPGERLSVSVKPFELLRLQGRQRASCLAHAAAKVPVRPVAFSSQDTAASLLRSVDGRSLELEWDVVEGFHCGRCGFQEHVLPLWQLRRELLVCRRCGGMLTAEETSSVAAGSRLAEHTLEALGVPSKAHLQVLTSHPADPCWYKIL